MTYYRSSPSGRSSLFGLFAVAIPAIALLGWLWGPQLLHGAALALIGGAAFFTFAIAIAVLAGYAFASRGSAGRFAAGVLAALVVIVGIGHGAAFAYNTDLIYTADVEVVDRAVPDFADRAPYDVAVASATRNLGDTTGTAANSKVLVDESTHGVWSTLVERRGFLEGYEAVRLYDVPLYGNVTSAQTSSCEFDVAQARHKAGGLLPHNSLDYLVLANVPLNVTFNAGDLYAYCEDGEPRIVVPLKSLDGFWFPTWSAYGAAVYDGSTGVIDIVTDTSDLPGPVYPISLAATQRSAMNATSDFWDYLFGRSGFETTDGDEGDPNFGNTAEFGLRFLGQRDGGYVTPLTPRGDSTSIVALSVIDSTTATFGERNPVTVYRYPDGQSRVANTAIVQSMKSEYSWMPDWASGLRVFEIVPGADGAWVASLGQSQSVVYRAVIDADGSAVLFDANGEEVTRTSGAGAEPSMPGTETPDIDSDLSDLTSEQLRELAEAILNELTSRASE